MRKICWHRTGAISGTHGTIKSTIVVKFYKNFLELNSFLILNGRSKSDSEGEFTFISKSVSSKIKECSSVVDLAYVDACNIDKLDDFYVMDLSGSDHFPIVAKFSFETVESANFVPLRFKWMKDIKDEYKAIINHKLLTNKDQSRIMPRIVSEAAEHLNLKSRGIPPGYKAWFDKDLRELRKLVGKLLRKAKKSKWETTARESYVQACRDYQAMKREKKDTFYRNQLMKLSETRTTSEFWQEIKKFRRKPAEAMTITNEEWKNFFATLMPPREDKVNVEEKQVPELDEPFTTKEGKLATDHASNNKAPGLDGIPNELWKNLPPEGIAKLTDEFNDILQSEMIPEIWTKSETVMLHKKGSTTDPLNYRPIALAATEMKVFTYILAQRPELARTGQRKTIFSPKHRLALEEAEVVWSRYLTSPGPCSSI